ncbi:hypothetical protein Tco_1419705 [Tanacetum coccineum]
MDKSSSSGYDANAKKVVVDTVASDIENADMGPSYDIDTEVHHSNNDAFKTVFTYEIQSHEQPDSISNTYVVIENNSNIISDLPDLDPNRDKEEHNYIDDEQERTFFASLVNNLKCEVENCTKIKLLNEEISNLKSQACQKEKSFTKENVKYADYVQPLLKKENELEKVNQDFLKQINDIDNKLQKTGQTTQTFHMLLPKEDNGNTGKQGLGFENQNDVANPNILNKAKEDFHLHCEYLWSFTVCERQVYWNNVLMRFMDDLVALDLIIPPVLAGSWERIPNLTNLITPIKLNHGRSFGTVLLSTKPFEKLNQDDIDLSIRMMRSSCYVDESGVNISSPSTNKAFETPENSPDLEPSLNKLDELLTPPFIILSPNPPLHARIELE